ncbi:PQQ-dependent sugar dehydrogenase [Luteolibacter yonseiensis]|uniref:PQQ-dependent sugar dehydrogenase n=1 Tax=Luteolibacter yonseiensis TaxID=1144680 RepID=A0A934R8T9_9BACT|nr:PQQ-dependent sugar dehydrogenase [Luteolibacter yonseiensis]MBK1818311.1 PQQ-dependent sugar dehydrogenase [Luteolibacter yonseiensis]
MSQSKARSSWRVTALSTLLSLFCGAGLSQGELIRPDVGAYYDGILPPEAPAVASDWSTVPAFPNLSFLNPLGLTHIPGTNKLLVWEREGKIWAFDNDPAVTTKTLVVDLSANVQGWDDSGLLGLAVHPDFETNRQIYVWYVWRGGIQGGTGDLGPVLGSATTRPPTNTPNRNRLSRFVLDGNFQTPKASEAVVIDQKDISVWHNGGGVFFHPQNGFLYITNGDDTDLTNTQRIDRGLFSCVMRIDVDKRGGSVSHAPTLRPVNEVSPNWPQYYVPNDNPFVGQPNSLEEIYAIGLRSPHRMTIDPVTGRIFIGDVGADTREEVSVIDPGDAAGLNFQWNRIEGAGRDLTAPYIGVNKRPIIDYPHGTEDGSCVIGGYVYRGTQFPELIGKYIFGDNMSGRIWYLDESTSPAKKVLLATLPDGPGPNSGNDYRGLGSFGLDAYGEIYLCQLSSVDGRIFKLKRGGAPPGTPLPSTLSATGFFSDTAALVPSPRLLPYQINAPFWSDHAVKSRYAAIPNGTTVGFTAQGDWDFPTGSVLVKHFDLPVSDLDPAVRRRLETRFIVKKADGSVYGATYKWRADQSDADLLDSSLTESIPIQTSSLGAFTGQDIGSPALAGSTTREGSFITIKAGGTDIWGTSDQFHFASQLRTGDFDVSVRVESVTQADLYTKTGLMVRDSLAPNARHVMALVFPSNAARNNNNGGYEFQYRATTGGNATALYPPAPQPLVSYPNTWLRMKREGDTFIAYSSANGSDWREYSRTVLALPAQLHFGLAVTAHTGSPTTTAKFEIETRRQNWYYPSRQDCVTCHNSQAGGVLGLSSRQLNLDTRYHGGDLENQLRAWSHAGLFHNGPDDSEIPALPKLVPAGDTTASLETRARSYLDANCSNCHRPGGVHALWDARFQTPFSLQGINYGTVVNNLGNPDARVVVPQNLPDSILHYRVNRVGENQMPPLAKNQVDEQGVAMLAAWIQSLPTENVEAPSLLAAVARSHTRVDLSWQDNSDNESGFSIERSTDNVNFTRIGTVGSGVRAYSDLNAEPFTTQYYRVAAYAVYVTSAYSDVRSVTPDIGPPAPEVVVRSGTMMIPNNDFTPGDLPGVTDFGGVRTNASVTHTFSIANIGNAPLTLTGTPRVVVLGPDAASFPVSLQPGTGTIAGGASTAFGIRFSPQGTGIKTALVSILSDDPDEPVTTFAITGEGVSSDLAAWWKFNEASGTTAFESAGNSLTGTLTDPLPAWSAAGRLGGAIRFTGEVNQSVTVANHSSLNPTSAITITAWVWAEDWSGNRRILQKGNTDNQYRLLAENGKLVWDIENVGRIEADLPATENWAHLAATYNRTAMRLYVNGVQVGVLNSTVAMPTTTNPLYIGTKTPGSTAGDHFNGYLDDLRVYSSAVSASDIAMMGRNSGVVEIATSDGTAQKGTGDAGAISITRTGDTAADLPVTLSLIQGSGQAVLDTDFNLSPALAGFEIPAGRSVATVVVNPINRSVVTGPLDATVLLAQGTGYSTGPTTIARVRVLDTPYHQWKISAFGGLAAANGPAAGDNADPDMDGLANLLEGGLGGDPLVSDSSILPDVNVEFIDGQLYLTSSYTRPRPAMPGLTYLTRTSDTPAGGAWQDAVPLTGYPQDNGDGTETVKVRSALPVGAGPSQFMRLEIGRQ